MSYHLKTLTTQYLCYACIAATIFITSCNTENANTKPQIEPVNDLQLLLGESINITLRIQDAEHDTIDVRIVSNDTDIVEITVDEIRDATDTSVTVTANRDAAFNVTGALSANPTKITEVVCSMEAVGLGETTITITATQEPAPIAESSFQVQVVRLQELRVK